MLKNALESDRACVTLSRPKSILNYAAKEGVRLGTILHRQLCCCSSLPGYAFDFCVVDRAARFVAVGPFLRFSAIISVFCPKVSHVVLYAGSSRTTAGICLPVTVFGAIPLREV